MTQSPDDFPAISPTGAPLIPPSAVKYLTAGGAVLVALDGVFPANTIAAHVIHVLVGLVALFGIASPGLRLGK
jgi:hypothetical protein